MTGNRDDIVLRIARIVVNVVFSIVTVLLFGAVAYFGITTCEWWEVALFVFVCIPVAFCFMVTCGDQ